MTTKERIIQAEPVRRKAMNDYAQLQIFKLKVTAILLALAALKWWLT